MNISKHITTGLISALLIFGLFGCSNNNELADGYGYFETDEVLVSSRATGEILEFNIEEGITYPSQAKIGQIDTTLLHLQITELDANIRATESKLKGVSAQKEVLKSERKNVERELNRVIDLVKAGSATSKMQEDLEGKRDVIDAQIISVNSQIPAILGQISGLEAKKMQVQQMIIDSEIKMPFKGVILNKIAQPFEFTAPGKPLFRMADLDQLILRVYLTQTQLPNITLGQTVTVKVDGPDGEMIDYSGTISWVSSEAEFTPKTIQTKDTRVDLVYAVKVIVENDGKLKLGMPAEVWF